MPDEEKTQDQADGAGGAAADAQAPTEGDQVEEPKGGEG